VSVDILRRVTMFSGLSDEGLRQLSSICAPVHLARGQELFHEGGDGDRAYVLLDGALEITKSSEGRSVLLSVRQDPGELIGEMALVEHAPRMATVSARTAASLLAIPREDFDALLSRSPSATRAVFGLIISRLRDTQVQLQQSEKMAQLGTLTAGVAHELNNPAAAVKRSAAQLRDALQALEGRGLPSSPGEIPFLETLRERVKAAAAHPRPLSALQRWEGESAVESWLQKAAIKVPGEPVPELAAIGFSPEELGELSRRFPGALAAVLSWAGSLYAVQRLLGEILDGTERISRIVAALKSYSYLDRAPTQDVDLREGLESTLLILAHKLANVEIRREFADDVPRIEAYGSELNQVWTNLLDNAAAALEGRPPGTGLIILRIKRESRWAIVEIEDNGAGIPPEAQGKVFDAFYTTKAPGQGTGLGLHVSYGIVVNRHRGDITFTSAPGRTCFRVRLPIAPG
jgi:signal transduction histidine kinase